MADQAALLDILARVTTIGRSGGLSDDDLGRAINRLVSATSSLASATLDPQHDVHDRLLEGLAKNLNDDPMLVLWALKLGARLSDTCWDRFFHNFVIRLVLDRRRLIDCKTRELGHGPPVTLVVNPTMACNLRCRGCYSFQYPREGAMQPALLRKLLTEARDMGTRFITLSGGEPFLYRPLFDIVAEFHDMTFMSFTNGTLIDDAMADRIAAAGNIFPAFSVEGYERETTSRRGQGVYENVLDAMARLEQRGVLFGVSLTPTRLNSELLSSDELIDFYIGRGAMFAWLFTYIPVGKSPELDLMATPLQRNELRLATLRWRRTRPIFLGDFWNDGATCGGCLSASRYAFVTPEGNVQPCTFVHFYTHNIKDHSLQEIFATPFFKAIREAQPYDRNLLRSCKIIDHPHVLRRLVRQCAPTPSYAEAAAIVEEPVFRRHLDAYSSEYAALAERAWKTDDYHDGHRALVPFSGFVDLYERYADRMANAERVTEANSEEPQLAPQPDADISG